MQVVTSQVGINDAVAAAELDNDALARNARVRVDLA